MKVIRVSHFEASPVGHGGNHRAYQIQHDLELAVGKNNVVEIDAWLPQTQTPPTPNILLRAARRAGRELLDYVENPFRLLARTRSKNFAKRELTVYYEKVIQNITYPVVCIIEHLGFARLVPINLRFGIPTIICPHNLEAFDTQIVYNWHRWGIHAKAIDFANDFNVLSGCDERLFISKVEAGLISGLGLSSYYYPYLPVGIIRERSEQIRQERSKGQIEPGLFLMLGSAGHETTKESLAWFIQNAQTYGLPYGVKVVVVGRRTERLLPPGSSVPGLELRAWLEQDDLDRLLVQTRCVLIPQRFGFGSLTRLPEMSCAGIPVIVSRHPTYAIDPPPGLEIVDDYCWDSWYAKMEQVASSEVCLPKGDYYAWEEGQRDPLKTVVKKLLEDSR